MSLESFLDVNKTVNDNKKIEKSEKPKEPEMSSEDAAYAANFFIDFFSDVKNIEDHSKKLKMERMEKRKSQLLGVKYEDTFFNDYTMHPKDMDFVIHDTTKSAKYDNTYFHKALDIVSSHSNRENIPGRSLKWVVEEKNTGKVVGFIWFASPLMNSKPRNLRLGRPPQLKIFNQHVIMGFVIVPVQPFGYNYAGGKLLTLLCCSHKARRDLNEKYPNAKYCSFETTSLYGSSKASSQYDGLKPFIKFYGLTDSNFTPHISEDLFTDFYDNWFCKTIGVDLVNRKSSSKVLKRHNLVIRYVKKYLKDEELKKKFIETLDNAKNITQQKRFYICDYGFENSKEVILGEQSELIPNKQNYHKFELDYMINWWKNKATNRFENLTRDDRIRHKLELWNSDEIDFDIIR